jgi:Fe(3+) dicitrate transport protein
MLPFYTVAQRLTVSGHVGGEEANAMPFITVCLQPGGPCTTTDDRGNFTLKGLGPGTYRIVASASEYDSAVSALVLRDKDVRVTLVLSARVTTLDSVHVKGSTKTFGLTRLKDVDGAGIYAGKKSEVIVLKDLTGNMATNNSRQLYSKVAGLNIYETDGGAGTQLAIGGRGLDPNRVSNFNTRQNGYDISADALGYPESYYTPPAEVLEKIEIVRGAASLQYGTQFGGIINFKMNRGPDSAKVQVVERLTGGSWGFLNTSTSVGGAKGQVNYYVFYQHKSGDGWRPNAHFNVNMGYATLTWKPTRKLSISAQYTHMDYLERQPGGLNDQMFETDPRQSTKARNWFRVNWNLGAVLLDYTIASHLQFNSRLFGLLAERSALGAITTVNDPGGPRNYRTDNYTNWGNESRLMYTYHTKNILLGGVRYYQGYTNRQIGNGNAGSGGAPSDFTFDKSTEYDSLTYSKYTFPNHNLALFAENIFRLTPRLSVIPGFRHEDIYTKADGFYNVPQQDLSSMYNGTVLSNQLFIEHRISKRSFFIGGLGLSYDPSPSMQFYANISQNYRAINFNDMSIVNPNFRVDPNLKDEKGYSADLGIRGHVRELFTYDLSFFTIDYADRIGTVWLTDSSSITYQYTTNISKSRNLGMEAFGELDIWKLFNGEAAKTKLSVFTNLSLIDARYVNSKEPAYENKQVEFVPPVIFRSGITYQRDRLSATVQYAYTARQFGDATDATAPSNNGINGLIPAYDVMDLSADYKLSRIFLVSATVNNLADQRYYTRRADSYPGPGIIPADGRSFYLTMQVKL